MESSTGSGNQFIRSSLRHQEINAIIGRAIAINDFRPVSVKRPG